MPVDRRPLADLEDELYSLRRLIDDGLASIMAAHVIFPRSTGSGGFFQSLDQGRAGGTARLRHGAVFTDDCRWLAATVVAMRSRARSGPDDGLRRFFPMQQSRKVCCSHRFFTGER